jgi:hypothetical protein
MDLHHVDNHSETLHAGRVGIGIGRPKKFERTWPPHVGISATVENPINTARDDDEPKTREMKMIEKNKTEKN